MSEAPDNPDRSPGLLTSPPTRGPGVRRLNRLPILFGAGAAMLVVAAIGYTYRERLMQSVANAQQAVSHKPEPASGAAVLSNAPIAGEVKPAVANMPLPPRKGMPPTRPIQQSPATLSDSGGSPAQEEDEATKARHEAWQAYYQQRAQLQKERLTAATSAMTADTALNQNQGGQQPATASGTPSVPAMPMPEGSANGVGAPSPAGMTYPGGFSLPTYPPAQVDASAQREKQAFLNQAGDVTGSSDDLQATLRDPSSPYLVMAGTAIPAVMVGGINSDLPGMVIGQVAENVYDTATGRFLLIPQGSRLIGAYDNMVSNGQTRVGVIWNRVIFPDTESIDLGSMEGADQGGYAGFHDQVNTHFWSKIGSAILISIAGAGVQLSQPQAVNGQNYNSQQIAAAALGQQFGELGQEYARAGLSIPNTLEIRPGYRFVVMVNKDMHLRPYVDHRTLSSSKPVDLGPMVQ
jgi:type IV secretory pathway VirB10-like protein